MGFFKVEDARASDESGFVPAKLIKTFSPVYPQSELFSANAGFVEMWFVVDKNGAVYEAVVSNSSRVGFEEAALEVVKNREYEPATYNGKPIESTDRLRIRFEVIDQKNKVDLQFGYAYRRVVKELKKPEPDKKKISKQIKKMEKSKYLSPYAYVNLSLIHI